MEPALTEPKVGGAALSQKCVASVQDLRVTGTEVIEQALERVASNYSHVGRAGVGASS